MFETMRIRAKLIVALAIPLLALVGLSTFVVALSSQQADDALARSQAIGDQVALATSALGPRGLIGALQTERNSEALTLAGVKEKQSGGTSGQGSGVVASDTARDATDTAVAQFTATIADSTPAVREIFAPAVSALSALQGTRQTIDASTTPVSLKNPAMFDAYRAYSTMVRTVFEANSKVALGVDDADLRNGATIIDLWSRSREDGADLVYAFISTIGASDTDTLKRVADARTRDLVTFEGLTRTAAGPYRDIIARGQADTRVTEYRTLLGQVYSGESKDVKALIDPTKAKIWGTYADIDREIGDQLNADATALRDTADLEAADAQRRQRNVILVGIAALLAAAGVTLAAARSISRPLRRLARDAEEMAAQRLPGAVKQILDTPPGEDVVVPELEAVPSGGGSEINEVASALNSVQSSAANLAVEQALLRRNIADSFVNLGLRNQNLLNRQITSITQMERNEADPDALEELFKLDHLAIRMRRNAESLLLLGGQARHRQWSAPLPLVDVIRGAMGEVEEYERVHVRYLDEGLIKGSAASDVTHMLAELLENALSFSPPNRDVEIVGRAMDGDYQLAIVDGGIGMDDEELALANLRLSGGESFTVAPSRYLGHYVVGVQAARLGARVWLQASPGGGVTACISLGDTLADGPVPAPVDATEPPVEAAPVAGSGPTVDQLVSEAVEARTAPSNPAEVESVHGARSDATMAVSQGTTRAVTASGYTRRQRGANVPRTDVVLARGGDQAAGPAAPSTTGSVSDLLGGFQAGEDRARTELGQPDSNQEDAR
jgi:signal transduction histidine kinase